MKVLIGGRHLVYEILSLCFGKLQVRPKIAELGVLKGDNAAAIDQLLRPSELFLVDAWSAKETHAFAQRNHDKDWVTQYYGGPLQEQATYDALFRGVSERFSGKAHVKIIRGSSRDALPRLRQFGKFDLVYVDADHAYEQVFADLTAYQELLGPQGVFQLNDCCHSPLGVSINLGVLEAVVKFCKVSDFCPAILTSTDFSDVLLVRRNSRIASLVHEEVNGHQLPYVEVPEQLLGAARVVHGKTTNLSFV